MAFMQGLFGSKPKATATAASGVQLQSSSQGLPIPLVFGTTSIAPNLIWYGDFVATQQSSSAGSGGKGGSSGGKGGGGSSYVYQAAFAFGLCAGPIQGVGNVYVNKQVTTLADLGYSFFTGTSLQTPWGYLTSNHPGQNLGYNYLAYIANPSYQLGNSPQIPNNNIEVQGIYSNSVQQENYGEGWVLPANAGQGIVTSVGGSSTVNGSGQPVITVNYAAYFISDGGVTDIAGNVYTAVGSSPGNMQYTVSAGVYTFNSAQANVQVYITYTASIGADADPSLILNYLLTDPRQGVLFPSANLGSLTKWQAYCIANGLLLSPGYTQQNTASSMITDIMTATNSNIVSSGGVVTVVPYGDQSITANGYTYTAPSSPIYSLSDDDFIRTKNQDPVMVTQQNGADVYNSLNLTCLDRANQYNTTVLNAKSQAAIDEYGLRENTVDLRIFANLNAARLSVQLQLHRQEVRNQYSFTLDHRYLLLDPMDIVEITDTVAGIVNQWVRITSITEDDNGNFAVTAEEYLAGNGSAPQYTLQKGTGYNVNYNASPGNANTPVIFEPPVQISQTGGIEVDIACSGGSSWGGCDVYVSTDNSSYKMAGRITGPARQGVLSANLALGTDPDTTDTLSVNLSESNGSLNSGTQNDADTNVTLCYVDGEYISYETATLTSANNYNLTYLRRGQFGSTIAAHNSGAQFARMDGGIFAYAYDKSKIGQTLYIKLLSFNIYGGGEQTLSDVNPYTHVLTGPPLPGIVNNFSAQQQGNVVVFGWQDLQPNDVGLKGYDIAFGQPGSTWAQKEVLTNAARGTEMTNAAVPPGTWEFAIRAHDIADNLGPVSITQLIVVNQNSTIADVKQEPNWLGTLTNCVRHWSGVLIPKSQYAPSHYAIIAPPSAPTLSQTAGGSLTLGTLYTKITYTDLTGQSLPSTESSLSVSPSNVLVVASPGASGLATGYNVYVGSTSGSETLQNASPIGIGVNWTMPTTGLVSGAALPTRGTTGWQTFNKFVPDVVTSASYISPTIDTGYNDALRVYSTSAGSPGPGETGQPSLGFAIDTWLTGGSDPNVYTPWTIGTVTLRYLNGELTYAPVEGSVSYISDFTVLADTSPVTESANSAVISAGGTTITYPTPYHTPPYMPAPNVVSPTGAGYYATAVNISATQFTAHVWNASGVDVGGTINWTATGS